MGQRVATELQEGGGDTALASFVLLLSFLDRPADPEQLRHLSGRGSGALETDDLVCLAKRLEVEARKVTVGAGQLEALPLPAGMGKEG